MADSLRAENASSAALWPPIATFIACEAVLGARIQRKGRIASFAYEFLRFGMKQGWACLFGGIMVALLIGTHWFYPANAPLARYDFLVIAALIVQLLLLAFRLETLSEAKVIFLFHIVGTVMEIFKTAKGSWIYPEASVLRIGGVPLFTGFMYASVGSYIARVWRLFDFRFTHHPPLIATLALSAGIYINFFTHHYVMDMRWLLMGFCALLFGRTWVYYKVWHTHRKMPLLLGFLLVSLFIWFAENIGTYTKAWIYPSQAHEWSMVPLSKLGAWFMLMIISYVMVSAVSKPEQMKK